MKRRDFFLFLGAVSLQSGLRNPQRRSSFKSLSSVGLSARPLTVSLDSSPNQSTLPKGHYSSMDAWIEIDLKAIKANLTQIKKKAGVRIMAVVKANAYGHGLIEVSKALQEAGVDWLMVGKLEEAIWLRQAGLKSPILNFGPFDRSDAEALIENRISQSVYTDEVFRLAEVAAKKGTRASIHLDLDTGMGRTGIPYKQAMDLLEKIASHRYLHLEGLSTTLTEEVDFDREQVRRLNEIYSQAKKKGINCGLRHAASSAGLLESSDFCLDMVRPGITLYGYYPNDKTQKEDPLNLQPALRLKAKVIFIKDLTPGETLSYHRVFKAEKKMRVATLGLGYSDGYQPQLGGRAWVLIRGRKYSVLPLITANHLMIDLQNNEEIKIGDEAFLIDTDKKSESTADRLSSASGISPYRLLIGLNPLLPRFYFN
ncbi:MAG: alanine racemase [Candidatus Aminicenantes bacterium]|nr:alanine racemase [Candidatus Aminicenantes bacterium]